MSASVDLTERVERLELQNRKLRWVLLVGVLACLVLLMAGAAPLQNGDVSFDTIEAHKLAIVDGDGRDRLVLELDSGEPVLTMLNHAGMQQVYLGISENWNDSAYLSVCSRLENGNVDKQAALVATKTRTTGIQEKALPGNSQLVLYDPSPKQKSAAGRHLVRLSTGRLDELKPYFEIGELQEGRKSELDFEMLMSAPIDTGQRFLLDTTPDTTTISGVGEAE